MQVGDSVHLAAVRDATEEELRLYVNGELVGRRPAEFLKTHGTLSFGTVGAGFSRGVPVRWLDR